MGRIEKELSSVLAEALVHEMAHDPALSVEEDERAQRATASELVREALQDGQVGDVHVMGLKSFSSGNTAMLVARLETTLTFVVKVDRSPDLVAEAHLLRRAATDPALPLSIRQAFPKVFAIDDEGPVYGYLMENLEHFSPLRSALVEQAPDTVRRILTSLWDTVLQPAYMATRSTRVVPNIHEDYFARAEQRLSHAASLGLLPKGDEPLRVEAGEDVLEVPGGWGPVVAHAASQLRTVAPPFSTFVHGDPNPENILWREEPDGTLSFRLIDPKNWWTGDYLFDVAKIGHYLRVTAPVEHSGIEAERVEVRGTHSFAYDTGQLGWHPGAEDALLDSVGAFAQHPEVADTPQWQERYSLAVAANLLGIVGPRLVRASDEDSASDANLASIALAEGLRLLLSERCLT